MFENVFINFQWSSAPSVSIHKQPGNLDTCGAVTENTLGKQQPHKYKLLR